MSDATVEREAILNDPAIRESVERGLAQSAAGETTNLGSFAQYLKD
jgi:hypothetical protein